MVVDQGPFWSVFEHSNIPMALVDRARSYIAINDAAVALFQYQRDDVIGERAGRTTLDPDLARSNAEWEELLRTGELYGERVVSDAMGNSVRVSYAAHATRVEGDWAALLVALSAHVEPANRRWSVGWPWDAAPPRSRPRSPARTRARSWPTASPP